MYGKLEGVEQRYVELERQLSDPAVIGNREAYQRAVREHADAVAVLVSRHHALPSLAFGRDVENPRTWEDARRAGNEVLEVKALTLEAMGEFHQNEKTQCQQSIEESLSRARRLGAWRLRHQSRLY